MKNGIKMDNEQVTLHLDGKAKNKMNWSRPTIEKLSCSKTFGDTPGAQDDAVFGNNRSKI